RTKEEVGYLWEEMRRTLVTLQWQANKWTCKASWRSPTGEISQELQEGLNAYAKKQARI
ncbi:hypothetical protein BDP27DRAFT_1233527, partial [Rhodocollybia butyracea]